MKQRIPSIAFLTICSLLISRITNAQTELQTTKNYLKEHSGEQRLTVQEIDNLVVSSEYYSATTGLYHIYLNQTAQDVEVYNGLLSVTLKNGKVVAIGNNAIENTLGKLPSINFKEILSPLNALGIASVSRNLTMSNDVSMTQSVFSKSNFLKQAAFVDNALSEEKILAKLYWYQQDGSKEQLEAGLKLVWEVNIYEKGYKHSWAIKVDATSGEVLDTKDNVIYDSFGESPHHSKPLIKEAGKIDFPIGAIVSNTYRVFDYPLESPNHGSNSIVTSPYTKFVPAATGPRTTNGWHNDGTTSYTYTRGNNVWAQEDANDNNGTGLSPSSVDLNFDYNYTHGLNTAAANQNAAITNLFYWNNLIHDVLWKYGFNEPEGNFQKDNLGRGGAGNDFVYADAQDGGGTNNANFLTPADGGNGRMQMYLWNYGNVYDADGDFDNGIIAHEYGHGWSNRLTGGPSCIRAYKIVNKAGKGGAIIWP